MLTLRRSFYLLWVALAVNVKYNYIPSLNAFLSTSFDPGINYELTVWKILTYVMLVYTCHVLSRGMRYTAEAVSRSNVTTLVASVVVVIGLISSIDVVYAYASGNDLFLLDMLYSTVVDPVTTGEQVLNVVGLNNSTISNVTAAINATSTI